MREDFTASYSPGAGADSGDIQQVHVPQDRKPQRRRKRFKDWLKMQPDKEQMAESELVSKCLVCGKEYNKRQVAKKYSGYTHGLCPECLDKARQRIKSRSKEKQAHV